MKKLTITDKQLFIAGFISIAFIATGSMVGTWIGITGMVAVSFLMIADPFESTELQGQLDEEWHLLEMSHLQREQEEHYARMAKQADNPYHREWAELEAEFQQDGHEEAAARGDYDRW